jgi:hypothetical protein
MHQKMQQEPEREEETNKQPFSPIRASSDYHLVDESSCHVMGFYTGFCVTGT